MTNFRVTKKILFIEDSKEVQMIVKLAIGTRFTLNIADTITAATTAIQNDRYDLILLDIHLPDGDGFKFCQYLKNEAKTRYTPVIFLTGKSDPLDKVMGFSLGAEDYIVKPIEPLEFLARVESKLNKSEELTAREERYNKGVFHVHNSFQKVYIDTDGQHADLDLTSNEFKLLCYLLRHESHVLSREQILNHIWGTDLHVTDRTVDTHIYALRKKLGKYSDFIKTVPKMGYKFEQDVCKMNESKTA